MFPEYFDATAQIATIQDKILDSRERRVESRDEIYDDIETSDIDDVLKLYEKMRHSKQRIEQIITTRRRKERIRDVVAIGSFIVAVITTIISIVALHPSG